MGGKKKEKLFVAFGEYRLYKLHVVFQREVSIGLRMFVFRTDSVDCRNTFNFSARLRNHSKPLGQVSTQLYSPNAATPCPDFRKEPHIITRGALLPSRIAVSRRALFSIACTHN